MRRLLLITTDAPPAPGGIARFFDGWLRWMPDTEWTVVTTTPGPAEHRGHRVRRVPPPRLGRRAGWLAERALVNGAGAALAARHRPDAVIIGTQTAVPAGLVAQRLLRRPAVFVGYGRELGADDRWTRLAASRLALTVTISASSAAVLRAAGARPQRLLVAPPGIEPLDGLPQQRSDGPPTVATVTRLDAPHKAIEDVAAAVRLARARIPDLRWTLIGSGEPYAAARDAVAAATAEGWASVHNSVSDEERDALLDAASVFALATRAERRDRVGEGFGIVFVEAAARGVPSVAPNCDGMRDSVADGHSGLLVAPADVPALADAIARIVLEPELAARLRSGALAHARAHAWPRVLDPVQRAIDRVIAGDPAPAAIDS